MSTTWTIPAWARCTTFGMDSRDGFPCAVHCSSEGDPVAYMQRIDEMTPEGQRIGDIEVIVSTDNETLRLDVANTAELVAVWQDITGIAQALSAVVDAHAVADAEAGA